MKCGPFNKTLYSSGGSKDLQHYKDYLFAWRSIAAQKVTLVCYKEGSNEIVGANFIFVTHKDDHFIEHFRNGVRYFKYPNEFVLKYTTCFSIESKSNHKKFDQSGFGTIRKVWSMWILRCWPVFGLIWTVSRRKISRTWHWKRIFGRQVSYWEEETPVSNYVTLKK